MRAYLMTRGTPRRLDYRYLDASPPQWWWQPLEGCVVLEQPEVVVRGGRPDGAGVLVSGVPSGRRDAVGTPIRFTLVLDGADPGTARAVAAAGLDPAARAALGAVLDAEFGTADVDGLLAGIVPDGDGVERRVTRVLDSIPPGARPAGPAGSGSWMGAVQDPRAVELFLDRVSVLAAGAPGWAFTTSALRSEAGIHGVVDGLDGPAVVLLDEGGPDRVVELGPGKALPGRAAGIPARRRPIPVVAAAVLGLLAITIVVLLLLLL